MQNIITKNKVDYYQQLLQLASYGSERFYWQFRVYNIKSIGMQNERKSLSKSIQYDKGRESYMRNEIEKAKIKIQLLRIKNEQLVREIDFNHQFYQKCEHLEVKSKQQKAFEKYGLQSYLLQLERQLVKLQRLKEKQMERSSALEKQYKMNKQRIELLKLQLGKKAKSVVMSID